MTRARRAPGRPGRAALLLLAVGLLVAGWCAAPARAAAFPDWTDCPAVCRCKWTSGKKSALCPDAGLTSLPASLDPDMQVLDLSDNQIPELQAEIFKHAALLNLQRIFLRNAGIHAIHGDAFKDMRILVEVDLSDNHLTSLENRTFTGNERLKLLVLSGNPLRVLQSNQFPVLQHLKNLELQRCSLVYVHPQALQRLSALETLSLDNNELEYLEVETIVGLKHLKTLGLDNNPWRCDCRLRDFCRLMTDSLSRLYSVMQSCIGPPRLEGRKWQDVRPTEFACEPTVRLPVTSIQEEMNGNVSLACLASGDPEPEVWWQLNGGPVNGTKRALDEVGPPGGLVTYSTSLETKGRLVERWSNLTIYNASDADAGEYTCHARNVAGTASDTVAVSIPRVFSAPTLSQADSWLLWLSLAGGGTAALCVSGTAVLLAACLCGGARRRSRRAKVKLQTSASYGDQEKKLLDLSVTTTTTTSSQQQHSQSNQNQLMGAAPIQADLNQCQPEFELELEPCAVQERMLCSQASASVTVERLRLQPEPQLQPLPPPPQLQQQQQQHQQQPTPPPPAVLCPVAMAAAANAARGLSPALPANIFISVSLASSQPERNTQSPQPAQAALPAGGLGPPGQRTLELLHQRQSLEAYEPHERCYPDLLDIGLSSFATLPRRSLGRRELGSPYDNMGPRVTATGSSTFSLAEQPEPTSGLQSLTPSAGNLAAAAPLIQPPPEFVSL